MNLCTGISVLSITVCFCACSKEEPKADKHRDVVIENIESIDSLILILKDESTSCEEKARLLEARKKNHAKPEAIDFNALKPNDENKAVLEQYFKASKDLVKIADRYHQKCKQAGKTKTETSSGPDSESKQKAAP